MSSENRNVRFSESIQVLPSRLTKDRSTIGDIIRALGDRAIGPVLIVFAIPAIIPTPGVPAGMIFGSVLVLVGLQMIIGTNRLRLPPGLSRIPVRQSQLESIIRRAVPFLEKFERRMHSRATALCSPRAQRLLGVAVVILAILIALPIPFGNTLPGFAVLIMALGLTNHDGLAVAVGLVFGLVASIVSAALVGGSWWLIEAYLLR